MPQYETLREVLEEKPKTPQQSQFWPYIEKLDQDAQAFFINQFYQKGHNVETKRGIVQRLYGFYEFQHSTGCSQQAITA